MVEHFHNVMEAKGYELDTFLSIGANEIVKSVRMLEGKVSSGEIDGFVIVPDKVANRLPKKKDVDKYRVYVK